MAKQLRQVTLEVSGHVTVATSGVRYLMQQSSGEIGQRTKLISTDNDTGRLGIPEPEGIGSGGEVRTHGPADADRLDMLRDAAHQAGDLFGASKHFPLCSGHLLRRDPLELETAVP